jgi:hypothetical protein
MKGLSIIIAAVILVFGTVAARAANLDRISAATGIPVATLQAERESTGLGWGSLEKAHLLANASGQSFDDIVAQHQAGQGWGKIAHNNGLNLGRLVSNAHRSSHATMHAQNLSTVHGKSTAVHGKSAATDHGKSVTTVHGKRTTNIGRGHAPRMTSTRGAGHSSSLKFSHMGSHGVGHGMGGTGHGRGR